MFRRAIFSDETEPRCSYCEHGTPTSDDKAVLCRRLGVVPTYSSCRHFSYDPIMRVPMPSAPRGNYTEEDFSL